MQKEFVIADERELSFAAEELLRQTSGQKIVAFFGEMGAGKTTLIKVFCTLLGVKEQMSSPTFSLVNEYRTASNEPIYHFDFYRIKTEEEALDFGYEDYFYSGHYCLIEWPERISGLLPQQYICVDIKVVEGKRNIKISDGL